MRQLRPYLWQGDVSELNLLGHRQEVRDLYGFTLAINVGSTPFVLRNTFTVYMPMTDGTVPRNDWTRILMVVRLAMEEIYRGGKVFVSCDAGLSRSIVFSGMVISAIERVPMGHELMMKLGGDPLLELWEQAASALKSWWTN